MARMGGDEFAALLDAPCDELNARRVAEPTVDGDGGAGRDGPRLHVRAGVPVQPATAAGRRGPVRPRPSARAGPPVGGKGS
ncbi:hypothetical protein ACFQDE_18520 [Deinococcus caeni]|uniref:hypothetical protein n=1 Tax=Deinococcus caeni TaxID=569127 RepID=UPI003612E8F5